MAKAPILPCVNGGVGGGILASSSEGSRVKTEQAKKAHVRLKIEHQRSILQPHRVTAESVVDDLC